MTYEERKEAHRVAEERRRRRNGAKPRRTNEVVEKIIDAYDENPEASYETIARLVEVSWSTVRYHVKKLGLRERFEYGTV